MKIQIDAEPCEVAALFAKLGISVDVNNGEIEAVAATSPTEKRNRMRTAHEAFVMLKTEDPESAVSENAVRRIYKQGLIPIVENGRRKLADYDVLRDYLTNPDKYKKPTASDGKIRKIN